MGKVKLLLDVIGDLRSLADSLQAVADAVAENDASAEMTFTKESEEKSRTKAAAKKNTAKKTVKAAFVTMINKLIFSQQTVLKPLLRNMQGYDEEGRLQQIENIEAGIEKVKEKKQVLVSLMTSGLLEPPIFQKENNALIVESERLKARKENLLSSVSIDNEKADALKNLIKFVSGHEMLTEYDEGIFESHVKEITVISRKEIIFGLHCGLNLKERLDG